MNQSLYNTTRRADPHLADRLLHYLTPQPNGLYLDIGCGTGNYTAYLAERGVSFWGVDPSETMLAEAGLRSARAKTNRVQWLVGTADAIPADAQIFDGAIATLTIHHWPNLSASFRELQRVLKPGARLVLFTAIPEQMRGYWLNAYFPRMLAASIGQMPALTDIAGAAAGFTVAETAPYFIQPDSPDLFLYAGKHRPEVYLDPVVRRGISSFAALAHTDEVEQGLKRLRSDLDTGAFERVRAAFATPTGDYLFVVMHRN